ncbi:hypothetical protein BKA62DRAFT_223197 [Auriculariales sp. MPI-PUGE-AT-0066]|nr:hypothetical protein BKA62DRAFT_223197 [Auriculariales sp. MPI-PUGE-AT-0066]
MANALTRSILQLREDFFVAVQDGEEDAFNAELESVLQTIVENASTLPEEVIEAARALAAFVSAQAARIYHLQRQVHSTIDANDMTMDDCEEDDESLEDATPLTQALHDWFCDHLAYPYPSYEDKRHLVELCIESGWDDADVSKVEDWFVRHRQTSGWNTIITKYCNHDQERMRELCERVLCRLREECIVDESLDQDAVDDLFEMQTDVAVACGRIVAEKSAWFSELVENVEPLLEGEASTRDWDEEETELDYSDPESDDSADTDSCCDTEMEETETDDEEPRPFAFVTGVKRKYADLATITPPRRFSRTLSSASSSSSSSRASFCSFSGSSASSTTSIESDDEDSSPRLKRRKFASLEQISPCNFPLALCEDAPSFYDDIGSPFEDIKPIATSSPLHLRRLA